MWRRSAIAKFNIKKGYGKFYHNLFFVIKTNCTIFAFVTKKTCMNIGITSGANCVKIDFNDMAQSAGILRTEARKSMFVSVSRSETHVTISLRDSITPIWRLSVAPREGCLLVSEIDGQAITTLDELENGLTSILNQAY